ncbi:MAG: 4Fe-4S ferredoxin [Kiritimatiellae bacterium]|nr:4Fe-4S ferredoxin [Kiritimatiellia bacterium]
MSEIERQTMDADIVCVGFGPANAGFLTTLSRALLKEDGTPAFESQVMPGMPLQILCYERADDIGFGVSGVVTTGRSIRASFPDLDLAKEIPNAADVKHETMAYLFDPIGATRKSASTKFVDAVFKMGSGIRLMKGRDYKAAELPWIPPFLRKELGLTFSMGAFMSWAGAKLMESGLVQIWPGTPVSGPVMDGDKVIGVRLADQGVDKKGNPDGAAYMPGMDIHARLTVVGDGPVGAVGRKLDDHFGLPPGNHQHDWAVGMKAVVQLPDSCTLEPGTVIHTMGFPEPEIFGFFYVYPDRSASMGIFVPSWWESPVRTSYRYLQHWMMHPYIWRHIEGGSLRSWGAKSLQESGMRGEPYLCGDGYVRIGEGSGTTNVLTNSGVDEAWRSGVILAESVIDMLKRGVPFTKGALEGSYVRRRREDGQNKELERAKYARDGFQKSFMLGMMGTGMAGITKGVCHLNVKTVPPSQKIKPMESLISEKMLRTKIHQLVDAGVREKKTIHDAVMAVEGWPEIPYDGTLLMSQQDALFKGGKVQAAGGFADHVTVEDPALCAACKTHTCVEICSAQALTPGEDGGVPAFDREKCVHCGACIWSCSQASATNADRSNIIFSAGSGGLHSNEN